MKKLLVLTALILGIANYAFAGAWYNMPNTNNWFYIQDDNSFAKNKWIVDNGKYYYFNNDGFMLSNTLTPDGYKVGADGAWIIESEKQNNSLNTIGTQVTSSGEKKKDLKNNIISKSNVEFLDSVKIGSKTWANVIKFSGNNSNIKVNSGDYNRLTFEAGVKDAKDDVEYNLTIFVNGDEAETITEFSSDGEQISIVIDKNSEVMLVYNCVVESGTYISSNNKALYIRKAQFERVKE